MHPDFFTIPFLDINVTTYGFCLMVGFLSAVWLAMRRADRVKADSDRVLDLAFLALLFGVGGARLMYVIHYWQRDFAGRGFLTMIDLRGGGLEFIGGLLGAFIAIFVYLLVTRQSIRLYLDILAPGAMWGLACGRIGCFFNGCCFGGLCLAADGATAQQPWAVQFPFGSPAYVRQWEERQVGAPAELISTGAFYTNVISASGLNMPVARREAYIQAEQDALRALNEARDAGADPKAVKKLEDAWQAARNKLVKDGIADVMRAQAFPSRENPDRESSISELEDLAAECRSLPVHPAQLYASIHAFALSGVLSMMFYRRKRHGVVIGVMFLLYPIGRVLLEIIRSDNPHDVAGLTVSQSISLAVFVGAAIYLFVLYKFMPERSPLAERARPKEEEAEALKK